MFNIFVFGGAALGVLFWHLTCDDSYLLAAACCYRGGPEKRGSVPICVLPMLCVVRLAPREKVAVSRWARVDTAERRTHSLWRGVRETTDPWPQVRRLLADGPSGFAVPIPRVHFYIQYVVYDIDTVVRVVLWSIILLLCNAQNARKSVRDLSDVMFCRAWHTNTRATIITIY